MKTYFHAVTYDGDDTVMKEGDGDDETREYPCIVRVTDGKKAKFSTKVHKTSLQGQHHTYDALDFINRPRQIPLRIRHPTQHIHDHSASAIKNVKSNAPNSSQSRSSAWQTQLLSMDLGAETVGARGNDRSRQPLSMRR